MININNVSHHINGNLILNQINLTIPGGGIIALIGPNGAGKSTLLSLMARLEPLQQGEIHFDGLDICHSKNDLIAKKLAILPQENSINSRISVRDLLMFGRYPYHKGRPQAKDSQIIEEAIAYFRLEDLANCYITELSGGQRQRALVAMVFCQTTDYILLDEPLNNLDMFHTRELMQLLTTLAKTHQRTVIIVLHDINQAAIHADRIIALQQGKVLFDGEPNTVITPDNMSNLFNIDVDIIDYRNHKLIMGYF